MRIEIRRATSSDSDRATALARRAKAHWGYPAEWLAVWDGELAITAADIDQHRTFVASLDGEEAQGLIAVVSDPNAEEFYVKLGARRVGKVNAPMPGAPERTLPLLEFERR